jgi:site-specific recombinase XerD
LVAFLAEQAPEVRFIADIRRRHVEDFRIWLTGRSGYRTAQLTPATLAHRLGTLQMFFVRISDWDWPEAPARIPIIPADLRRQDHPLPKALDDPSAAKLLRAAQAEPRMLVRVAVEVLLRTGLRVGEFTALQAGAVVLIGAAHWLHVPVGKLHDDRYLPLHPHLVTLIDDYRSAHVDPGNPLLLPRENGRPRMARLRREHHRLLGNRPPELDCAFEAICETCTFFQTSIEFRPTLQRQHDHAAEHQQIHRADLFNRLLTNLDEQAS